MQFNVKTMLQLSLTLSICLPIMFAAACAGGPDSITGVSQSQAGRGTLGGSVTRGPLSPVEGIPGGRKSEVVAGFRIVISGLDGRQVESVVTNNQGQYRANLLAGTYRVSAGALPRGSTTRELPATVTVKDGQETRLDIRIDTGIR
jgi:Carboxypeptidase regulatory-like domain